MPIEKRNGQWYYGSKGPFPTREKALEVSNAIHAAKSKRKTRPTYKPKPTDKVRGKKHMPKKR